MDISLWGTQPPPSPRVRLLSSRRDLGVEMIYKGSPGRGGSTQEGVGRCGGGRGGRRGPVGRGGEGEAPGTGLCARVTCHKRR